MYQTINDTLTNQPAQCIKRLADNAFIPYDNDNTDFAQFKLDLAEGVSLQDAEGNEMTAEQIADFLKTLP
jgi:hypothetical protein